MLRKEPPVAESPEHADAGKLGIAGRGNVNVAVAYIDSILASNP
jgi:hypothetical protein